MGIIGGLRCFFITKQHLCLGAACLLYGEGGGKGLCPPAWGTAADPLMPRARSPRARWRGAAVPLPGPARSHMPLVLLSPAVFPSCKTEQRRGEANAEALRCRSAFIFAAKKWVPWA